MTCFIGQPTVVTIRLDQNRYIVNELDGSLQVCIMLLEGSKIEDEDFFVEVSVSVSSDNITGAVVIIIDLIVIVIQLLENCACERT